MVLFAAMGTWVGTQMSLAQGAPQWVTSWMTAPCGPADAEPRSEQFHLQEQTVRQIVHLSIGGQGLRLRFSNIYGSSPFVVASVHVAIRESGDSIKLGTDKSLTFSGSNQVKIAVGTSVYSDPIDFTVDPSTDLAISFFVPEKAIAPAIHYTALQTSYLAKGDQTAAESLSKSEKTTLRLVLTGVDVATKGATEAIVAIGSSTTDGAHSTPNANHRWTDDLFERLKEARGPVSPAVLNAGISGNRVLHDGRGNWGPVWGQSAVSRFQRDVLSQSHVKAVVIFEGGNDIRQPAQEQSLSARPFRSSS
jgi:hypothetical protein